VSALSPAKAALLNIAEHMNAGRPDLFVESFSDDFVLHDPGAPGHGGGRDGVRAMGASLAALGDTLRAEIPTIVEEDLLVCVRWRLTWLQNGERQDASCVAIYRFQDGLIAEDWGILTRAPWP
jgi:predicted SnoaL-like aldol condensation-catalyzing enzyme